MARSILNPATSSPTNIHRDAVVELVRRYNRGELDHLNEKDLEKISILAAQMGVEFNVESKPIRKGLFDLADTATFGLLPDTWRPHSVGQEWHGESGIDKFAGGVGTLAGGALLGAGVLKGARYLSPHVKNLYSNIRNPFSRGGTGGGGVSGPISTVSRIADLNRGRDNLLINAANRYLPRTPGYLPSHLGRRVPTTPGMGDVVNIMNMAY